MEKIALIRIDLDKNSFYIPRQDHHNKAVYHKKFIRQKLPEFLVIYPAIDIVMEIDDGANFTVHKLIKREYNTPKLISP